VQKECVKIGTTSKYDVNFKVLGGKCGNRRLDKAKEEEKVLWQK